VDASPNSNTERILEARDDLERLADHVLYIRVAASLRGLTKQRNLALRYVGTDLVAFFDDDVVLRVGCLAEMVRIHRLCGRTAIGVGSFSANHVAFPPLLWQLRRRLRMVSGLQPGRYCRSGMSIPWSWSFVTARHAGDMPVEGDWLPGYAMSWKTDEARTAGFDEHCGGYGQGEDLEFSLRLGKRGKLLMTSEALVNHLEEPTGRPAQFALGYMAIYNRYRIHRRALADRNWRDVAWFAYAWSLDTVMLSRGLFQPRSSAPTLAHLAGRAKAACDIVTGR
jgi:GT2 family glycosyltransferase